MLTDNMVWRPVGVNGSAAERRATVEVVDVLAHQPALRVASSDSGLNSAPRCKKNRPHRISASGIVFSEMASCLGDRAASPDAGV